MCFFLVLPYRNFFFHLSSSTTQGYGTWLTTFQIKKKKTHFKVSVFMGQHQYNVSGAQRAESQRQSKRPKAKTEQVVSESTVPGGITGELCLACVLACLLLALLDCCFPDSLVRSAIARQLTLRANRTTCKQR